ncbi:hypothetical protein F3Y22_tig00111648pilonHSYRG00382 [Hibiscus syriacus]|uniref:HMG box domain-containing protein n=1 Tax=Hibiscus syriacus TaxID=106335 RepID=A0A6A2YC87_HIBSY|nr:hypothetical protein F3Y22_tig00111648pilonHSYRG00382 [Hibiscus syriacus]
MKSTDLAIVVGEDDFEIEVEIRKQPKGRYMYFYMTECQRMKEAGNHVGSVKNDVLEKWKSMTDAGKEPYVTRSKMDRQEYKAWRKNIKRSIKRVNSLVEHLKEKNKVNVLEEMRFGSLIRVRDRPIQMELCRSLVEQFDVQQCMVKYGGYSFSLGVPCAVAVLGVENKGKSVVEDRVLLYLVGIFLCPTGDTSPSKDNMKLICDEGLKGEFNWAEYVHSRLIESIISIQTGHQRYLKGCIAILETVIVCRHIKELEWYQSVHGGRKRQSRVEEAIERLKGEVGVKIDGVVKEVIELRGEVKMVMGGKIDGVVKEVVELREEKMEEVRRKDVDVIYTPESVIDADLDSECPPPKKKQKYPALKPMEWVGGAKQTLDDKATLDVVASFWEMILNDYSKFTDCDKIMISINDGGTHWCLLVLDMVSFVATVNDSLFSSPAAKNRVNDAKKLISILDRYNKEHIFVKACGHLKVPLKHFKFVEHKINEQLNGYDCGIYVIMRMEVIGSRGSIDDFVIGE